MQKLLEPKQKEENRDKLLRINSQEINLTFDSNKRQNPKEVLNDDGDIGNPKLNNNEENRVK